MDIWDKRKICSTLLCSSFNRMIDIDLRIPNYMFGHSLVVHFTIKTIVGPSIVQTVRLQEKSVFTKIK